MTEGLTQEDLAARSGLSVRALRDIERNRVGQPRPGSLAALAEALGLPESDRSDLLTLGRKASGSGPALYIGILGPLVVQQHGAPVEITQPMQRNLLGLLALHAGSVVSRDKIVDLLWGDDPPRSSASLVHDYVGRLRKLLEPDRRRWSNSSVVRLGSGGYILDLAEDQLDLWRLDERAVAGLRAYRAAETDAALDLLSQALANVRGPVLANGSDRLRQHPAATAITHRLLTTTLAASDIAIALGRHPKAIEWLRRLTEQAPLHEGLHARLVIALAANGDQAAALNHYMSIRMRLVDELGVEPTVELQSAYLRVLRQDLPSNRFAASWTANKLADEAEGDPAATGPPRASPVVPAQLPPDTANFTGRVEVLQRLDRLARDGDSPAGIRIAVVNGVAGVGKTSLAVRWAHRAREAFPDGQLYLNLREPIQEPNSLLSKGDWYRGRRHYRASRSRRLAGRMSCQTSSMWARQSSLVPANPALRQPGGFGWDVGQIECCSSSLRTTSKSEPAAANPTRSISVIVRRYPPEDGGQL